MGSVIVAGSVCVHESPGTGLWPTVAFDWCTTSSSVGFGRPLVLGSTVTDSNVRDVSDT